MALPPALKEKAKEKEEVREGEADEKKGKKPPFMKKGKKDTEIEKGGTANEGVTKANRSTMASLDDENNDSGSKKMDKKGKDCGCDHKNDALTPQEYLAACEGGFQDQSRVYIRARLDAVKREDRTGTGKKCGNSYIPRQATCNVTGGGGTRKAPSSSGSGPRLKDLQGYGAGKQAARQRFANTPGSTKGFGNKVKATAELAANTGSALSVLGAAKSFRQGQYGKSAQQFLNAGALNSIAAGSKAQRQGNTALAKDFNRMAGQLVTAKVGVGALQVAGKGNVSARSIRNSFVRNRAKASNAAFSVEQRLKGFRKYKPDSVWADGFGKFDAETALSANSMNLATDKYKGEKRKRNAQGQPRNIIYANTFNT